MVSRDGGKVREPVVKWVIGEQAVSMVLLVGRGQRVMARIEGEALVVVVSMVVLTLRAICG